MLGAHVNLIEIVEPNEMYTLKFEKLIHFTMNVLGICVRKTLYSLFLVNLKRVFLTYMS